MRGDNVCSIPLGREICGSPPRAWGQLCSCLDIGRRLRFTPTCVGTTRAYSPKYSIAAVHPHVRGDNMGTVEPSREGCGSPPRAWGQLNEYADIAAFCRFTPTCVGTTHMAWQNSLLKTVHPHVRGDNYKWASKKGKWYGSPPRAWGQRALLTSRGRAGRFTPTCVGTTCAPLYRWIYATVHPHVRGDNGSPKHRTAQGAGSPPRAWGQRQQTNAIKLTMPVHPHVRGDNREGMMLLLCASGSPPRAWGQHSVTVPVPRTGRFTPTCVGTTLSGVRAIAPVAVHPHVRGDNVLPHPPAPSPSGSPPRAWGQRGAADVREHAGRFTPTCVGTTRSRVPARTPSPVHPHVRGDNFFS